MARQPDGNRSKTKTERRSFRRILDQGTEVSQCISTPAATWPAGRLRAGAQIRNPLRIMGKDDGTKGWSLVY